jgi:UDP-2,3-diacylglucosamine pyrophosphatase LpxH
MREQSGQPLPMQHRTLFLSDLHLGAVGARADLVLRFLRRNRAETYVLVGDVLDLWHPVLPQWGAAHQGVIDHLARRRDEGAALVYIAGNHDTAPDTAPERRRLPVAAQAEWLFEGADGRRFLVTHGDAEDRRALRSHLLTRVGSLVDNGLRRLDRSLRGSLSWRSPAFDPQRRSAIEWILSTANALFYPDRGHERRLIARARDRGLDGVICGHFHIAALHDRHGLIYANCGDWMDSFTALAEDGDGRLALVGGRAAFARAPRPVPASGAVRV